jgi:hypothetical protein
MNKAVKIILGVVVFLVLAYFGLKTWTKSSSPNEVAAIQQNGIEIEVDYCRPSMKGREIFGGLVPYDKVWRTGANEATTIEFNKDVFIKGNRLAAGKYSLWTVPNPESWDIIFNDEIPSWGTNYDESTNVLTVSAAPENLATPLEQFTISFAGTDSLINMNLSWENTSVTLPIK